ncbi:hypothetical protein [Microbulbifer rhizosphaerae]|uniref:Uncharacterized protein n=1 Tax=Microbulbifer rhizosphaerae TaxID=1562603 RepID=A0A7W4W9Z9_9GAMM|nr:hypothetical protein [Microbulbifer rhizosphaerae]MBB3060420.1 hypothetical protein [Microbulbifer rhizosphaerae]
MRFLIPLILMCSLAGYSQAQEQLRQLPSGATEVQVRGQTYYQHGNTFYRYHPQGGYFYEVSAPRGLIRAEQPRFYRRSLPEQRIRINSEEGCRNWAAEHANRNPSIGGKIYMRQFNRCMNMLRQQ